AFRIIFIAFILYAGFGVVTPHMSPTVLLIAAPLYFLYLNLVFRQVFQELKPRILLVIWVFLLQFVVSKFVHNPLGGEVYLLFGFVLGRFLGIDHPPSEVEMNIG